MNSMSSSRPSEPKYERRFASQNTKTNGASHYVKDELRADIAAFAVVVAEGCDQFGGSVISWCRSPERNAKLKNAHPKSRHLLGLAADITFRTGGIEDMNEVKQRCAEAFDWFTANGLRGYVKRSRVAIHIQDRPAPPPSELS